MSVPIQGYEGTVTINGTMLAWVTSWEATLNSKEKEVGPFLNDGGNVYIVTASRQINGKLEATIPVGKDPGQTAMLNRSLDGTNVPVVLSTDDGYVVTLPTAIITGFSMKQEAADTVTISFNFRSNGAFTIV